MQAPAAAGAAAPPSHKDPGKLDLNDVDVFLHAIETGDFVSEARYKDRQAAAAGSGENTFSVADVLDPVLPPAGSVDLLHTYEYTPTRPLSREADPAAEENICNLSRQGMRLNGALAAKLEKLTKMCEDIEADIERRKQREEKLVEANGMFQQLLNALLMQRRADSTARRKVERKWRNDGETEVGPLEVQLLSQRAEMHAMERELLLLERQISEEETRLLVLRRELACVDPSQDPLPEEAPTPAKPTAPFQATVLPVESSKAAAVLAALEGPRFARSTRAGAAGADGARLRKKLGAGRRARIRETPTAVVSTDGDEEPMTPRTLLRARDAFDSVDELCQCDGSISRGDLYEVFSENWGDAERFFRELDADGNGDLTPQEWIRWLEKENPRERARRLDWIEERVRRIAPLRRRSSPAKAGVVLPTVPSPPFASTTQQGGVPEG